ncbi:MAG: hypothetical protein AAFQ94_18515 [Bacteroidota bacterium]
MKIRLLLITLLLSFNAFSQNYKEKDLYGFWRKQKTVYKDIWDTESFSGFNYLPINFLYFKSDQTYTSFWFNRTSYNFDLVYPVNIWKLEPNEEAIFVASVHKPDEFEPLQMHKFKPGKKLVLLHRHLLNFENSIFVPEKSEIEILTTFKKCSIEEVLNVSIVENLYLHNREVNKIEWKEYAYDLEYKDEIIFSTAVATRWSIVEQFSPVLNILQEEAIAFCKWKEKQIKGVFGVDVTVRLPRQKEWEKLSSFIKNGNPSPVRKGQYRPDVDSFYFTKPVKMLKDTYEWCSEEGLVFSTSSGVEPLNAAAITKTGFRYIIEFR